MSDEWQKKYDALVEEVRNIGNDMGIYPQAVKGYNDERDYEQRDGYKNGWNAAILEYGQAITEAAYRAQKSMSDELTMLLAADVGKLAGGKLVLNMSDTWGWATAWAEPVPEDELPRVAELFERYGHCGLYYWVTTKHLGLRSEFHDINRMVDFVAAEEKVIAEEPDSNKRAYKKVSYSIGV